MSEKMIKIIFVKKTSVELADNEKISLWDNESSSSISTKEGSICLIGCWKVSLIGKFLGSGLLGYIFIRPFFMHGRMELLPVEHVERVIIGPKQSGKKVYHLFQKRDAGSSEVHVFKAVIESDEVIIENVIASVIPIEKIQKYADVKPRDVACRKVDEKDVVQLKTSFTEKPTDELKAIYAKRDTDEYRTAAIEAARRILAERGEII